MITRIDAASGETIDTAFSAIDLGAVIGELRETHITVDLVRGGEVVISSSNKQQAMVDVATGDVALTLRTDDLTPGDYAVMAQVLRPTAHVQRKIIQYVTIH